MHAYRLGAGGSGALRCSAKHLLNCLYPHRSASSTYPFKSIGRQATSASASFVADSGDADDTPGPSANTLARSDNLTHMDPDTGSQSDTDTDADLGPGPGPGSLRSGGGGEQQQLLPPGLYVIPTPIGNLQDITLRAADTLRRVNLLLAEDTRHTRKLLNFLNIRHVELLSCHEHNEKQRLAGVMQRLQMGEPVGLVSDAGMPGISDPGHQVVTAAVAAGVRVVALPGPCAFVTALVGSGLPTDAFTFVGFLPPKSGARRKALERLASHPETLVLYAPPHGLAAVLRDCAEALGAGRRCCVAREISKIHEEYYRSTIEGALREFSEVREPRGEICLLVEGCGEDGAAGAGGAAGSSAVSDPGTVERVLRELLVAGMPVSGAVKEVVVNLGANKKAAYSAALRVSESLGKQ